MNKNNCKEISAKEGQAGAPYIHILCEIDYEFKNPAADLNIIFILPDGKKCYGRIEQDTYPESEFQLDYIPEIWPYGSYQVLIVPAAGYRLHEIFLLLHNMDQLEEELFIRSASHMEFELTQLQPYACITVHYKTA